MENENRVLRSICGSKGEEVSGSGENYIMRSLMISTAHQIRFLGDQIVMNVMGGACGVYGERKVAYMIIVGNPEGKNRLYDTGVDGSIILRWILCSGIEGGT